MIVELPSGHDDCDALCTTAGGRDATYLPFDLMMLAGNNVRGSPLMELRATVAKLLAKAPPANRCR